MINDDLHIQCSEGTEKNSNHYLKNQEEDFTEELCPQKQRDYSLFEQNLTQDPMSTFS